MSSPVAYPFEFSRRPQIAGLGILRGRRTSRKQVSHVKLASLCIPAFLVGLAGVLPAQPGPGALPPRVVAVDFSTVRGRHSTVWKECIGAGRANEGLRADWQEQLALVQKEIGFRYIRMHGLLHDDMGVYHERADGSPIYNWQYVDKLYDYLQRIGLKPFVELAFMPHDLASANKTVFWWRGNITPPKSYEKWGALVANLVRHLRDRYGDAEVKTWYFEVWNEPDIAPFWSADLAEYFKLYKSAAEAVKSVSKEYRVGGPASAIPYQFEEELLKYCVREHVPLDFISTHAYGVKEGFFDETGGRGTVLDGDRTAVRARMVHSRELIRNSPLPNLPLHFTEWSSAYTPTDYVHDQYHQAAFILDKIKGAQESVDSHVLLGVHRYLRGERPAHDALSRRLRALELSGHTQARLLRVPVSEPAWPGGTGGWRRLFVGLPRCRGRRPGATLELHAGGTARRRERPGVLQARTIRPARRRRLPCASAICRRGLTGCRSLGRATA